MGLADMDITTAPAIIEAIRKRTEHGIFGYTLVPEAWTEAYQSWWQRRHHFTVEKEWLLFCTGVVPAISSIVRKVTTPAEKVVLMTPVYNIFFNSIINNGRQVLQCPLVYKDQQYSIDFQALENCLCDPQVTLLILCNPHNPIGKIWDKATLFKIGQLCDKHHVLVLSDEIHCDLIDPGYEYIPFASVSKCNQRISITCVAPTKAFNLAGLQTSAIIVCDPVLRHKVWRAINTDEIAEPNVFAIEAAIAAWNQSEDWLDALREYLAENKTTVRNTIKEKLPELTVLDSNATYLLWIDCKAIVEDSEVLQQFLQVKTGLILTEGKEYGESGKAFLRMNTAVSKERLQDGLNRLVQGVKLFIETQN